jgi:hypothetical protein
MAGQQQQQRRRVHVWVTALLLAWSVMRSWQSRMRSSGGKLRSAGEMMGIPAVSPLFSCLWTDSLC